MFHAQSLRTHRYSQSGLTYLITTVTKNRHMVFYDFYAARMLVRTLQASDERGYSKTIGFTVMPDHLHWMVQLGSRNDLAATVGFVKGYSAYCVNNLAGKSGPLWQHGFHDRAIRKDEDIVSVMRYVIGNPLRAGLVTEIGEYPHWDCIYL